MMARISQWKFGLIKTTLFLGIVFLAMPPVVTAAGDLPVVLAQAADTGTTPSNVVTTTPGKNYVFDVVIIIADVLPRIVCHLQIE